MGWSELPVVGHTYDQPPRISRAAWQEIVDGINERSQFLGLGDLATDIPVVTPAAAFPATGLKLSMLTALRAAVDTLAPYFRRVGGGGVGEAWTASQLHSSSFGSADWPAVAGGTVAGISHINTLYYCLAGMLDWIGLSPDAATLQRVYQTAGSAVSWDASWAAVLAAYPAMDESGDDLGQLSGYDGITGAIRGVNTDADGKLYMVISWIGSIHTIPPDGLKLSIYKDAALTQLVAHVASLGGGANTLTADGGSGLAGTVTVDALVGEDAGLEITRVKASTGNLVGFLGTAHSGYSHELENWHTVDLPFAIPDVGAYEIWGTYLRWQGVYSGRHTPWRIYPQAEFAGTPISSSYILTGWNTLNLSAFGGISGGTTQHYSLRPNPQEPTRSNYRPADSDAAVKGSHIDDAELLIAIGFDFW
jgi:hypothetical protein